MKFLIEELYSSFYLILKTLLALTIFSFTGFGTYNFGINDIRVVQALTIYYIIRVNLYILNK